MSRAERDGEDGWGLGHGARLARREGESVCGGGLDSGIGERGRVSDAREPGGELVEEPGAGWVAGLAQDEVEGRVVGVGEVGGEAFRGAKAAANLLDGGAVARLWVRAGADGDAEEVLEDGGGGEERVLDVDGVLLAITPVCEVGWGVLGGEAPVDGGGEEVVPGLVLAGEPAVWGVLDEELFGKGALAPGVEVPGLGGSVRVSDEFGLQ